MEPDPADTGSIERPSPAVANRVLVWRIFHVAAEDPRRGLGLNAIAGDVAGKQLDQLRCEEDGSLAAALGRPQFDAALVGSLDLPHHGQLLAEEVDVADLDGCGLTETEAGERSECDKGSAACISASTCSCVGSRMAASRRRWRGMATPSDGSWGINRSRTAARNTERTSLNRVLIVPAARSATTVALTHCSTFDRLMRPSGRLANGTDLAARFIALTVLDSHT